MNNELIGELSLLTLEEKSLKRNLDRNYYNESLRTELFTRLKEVQRKIRVIKFKLRLNKEIGRNEKSRKKI